jgi:hypothetical protein
MPWALAGVFAMALIAALLVWSPWRSEPPRRPSRFSTQGGADGSRPSDLGANALLSPDAAVLAFVAAKNTGDPVQIYVRRLEHLQAAALAGTEGASSAFVSPDGQSIAFFAGGTLKKVSVNGGAAVTLCNAANPRGMVGQRRHDRLSAAVRYRVPSACVLGIAKFAGGLCLSMMAGPMMMYRLNSMGAANMGGMGMLGSPLLYRMQGAGLGSREGHGHGCHGRCCVAP